MDHALDHWLTRFAAGAGSQYVWKLYDTLYTNTIHRELLTYTSSPRNFFEKMCPLTAQATYEFGAVFPSKEWWLAAKKQGLTKKQAIIIGCAAVGSSLAIPPIHEVRARLLRICGVVESAPQRGPTGVYTP